MDQRNLNQLVLQSLEITMGRVRVYEAAIPCALTLKVRDTWMRFLDDIRAHERMVRDVFARIGLDTEVDTPGRQVVRRMWQSLIQAIELARHAGSVGIAQIAAVESLVVAETKGQLGWRLISEVAHAYPTAASEALLELVERVSRSQEEHLEHAVQLSRHLWLDFVGDQPLPFDPRGVLKDAPVPRSSREMSDPSEDPALRRHERTREPRFGARG